MTLASEMEVIARALLTELGESVTFTRGEQGTYDVTTGETSPSASSPYSGYAAPTNYSKYDIANNLAEQNDVKLYVEKTSRVPAVGDYCTLRDTDYRVMDVKRVGCNGADIIFICQLRV